MRPFTAFELGILLALVGYLVHVEAERSGGTTDKTVKLSGQAMEMPPLTPAEKRIIVGKGTERAYTGKYWNHYEKGAYICRQCGAMLYRSDSKFKSNCGWPSFDDEVKGAVTRVADADGLRTEITCTACKGHLGHVFLGEGFTDKNTRHCVNSASIVFVSEDEMKPRKAIFAGGCFWGVEHYFDKLPGVIKAVSGYTGGWKKNPTYEDICTGKTGHAEAVEITYDPLKVSYEQLARVFFEIHDPTQLNRQGYDTGPQYRSAVFYADDDQKQIALKLIKQLKANGYRVVTKLEKAAKFYPAEEYHQDFTKKNPDRYICHTPVPRFKKKVE